VRAEVRAEVRRGVGGGEGGAWVRGRGGGEDATYRAEVEVVGERRAHVGIRHVALDLWHVLVQPLQQQLLPRLRRCKG
jgi:hypothetical protein